MGTITWNQPKYPTEVHWKDTMSNVKKDIRTNHISLVSAAMAYYALFSIVPAITSFILIYAWISNPADIAQQINQATAIPVEVQEVLSTQLTSLASKGSGTLGVGAIFTLLLSLWSASKVSSAVMEALNIIYHKEEERSFIKKTSIALSITLLGILFIILALGVVVGIPSVFAFLNLGSQFKIVITAVSWIVLLSICSFYISIIYYLGPNREKLKWSWMSKGAVIASVLWAVVSGLFSWYASSFGNFDKTYGSLGAIIVVMTWFYLTSFVILLGGEINAELENQTKKVSS